MKALVLILFFAINLFFIYLVYDPNKSLKENLSPHSTTSKEIQNLTFNNYILKIQEIVPINNPSALGTINGEIYNKITKTKKVIFSYPNSSELLPPKINKISDSLALASLTSDHSCNETNIYYPINPGTSQTAKIQLIKNCQANYSDLFINDQKITFEIDKNGCDINLCRDNQTSCLKTTPHLKSLSTTNKKILLDEPLFCDISTSGTDFFPNLKIRLDGWNAEINHLYFTLIVAKANAINQGRDDEVYNMLTYYFDTETNELIPSSSVPTNLFPFE